MVGLMFDFTHGWPHWWLTSHMIDLTHELWLTLQMIDLIDGWPIGGWPHWRLTTYCTWLVNWNLLICMYVYLQGFDYTGLLLYLQNCICTNTYWSDSHKVAGLSLCWQYVPDQCMFNRTRQYCSCTPGVVGLYWGLCGELYEATLNKTLI